jgi:hypothetical protein
MGFLVKDIMGISTIVVGNKTAFVEDGRWKTIIGAFEIR